MEAILQTLRNLGPFRLALIGGVLLGLVVFFIFLITRVAGPQMSLLYSDLEADDSARIVSQLNGMDVPYDVRRNGAQIYVPADQVLRLRMSMADQGLPNGGSIGYELFDKADSLSTTNFIQNVNLVRALEGELARTIRSLESVRTARVHLVLPKRELFSRERQEPSASVILKMNGAKRLEQAQVTGIQHLVATSVPGLTPNRVSIIDGKGTLLARGYEDGDDPGVMAAKAEERRRAYEFRIKRRIEELLERTVGFGKVRAQVNAEMDFDRVSTSEEVYDPDGQVVVSTQSTEQSSTAREAEGNPPVTVAANLPDGASAAGEQANSQNAETRTEETTNFANSKKVVNHVREVGVVKRLSVAVLVDGLYNVNEQGQRAYQQRDAKEMELLATLVRGAIGFNAERGDSIEVINMQFADLDAGMEEPLEFFFGLSKNEMLRIAEILVLAIVVVLVVLMVVRPLISRAFEAAPAVAAVGPDGALLTDESDATPALTGPRPPGELGGDGDMDELIDIDRVEGRVRASSVKKVGEIVEKHPEEALAIIRSWLYQD
ncbi:MAG: flagellar M-ring protein FliF [Hyphomicrobiales bacterium]|nr:flagellar M-ring protein FliF [Hyphomicrobiales bacterium]